MNKNIFRLITSLTMCSIFFANATVAHAGLGISPSKFISPNLTEGSHIEKTFILSRSDPTSDLNFNVTMEGDTKDWTSLDKGSTFIMPKGQQRFPIVVSIDIPKNITSGLYKGGVRLVSSSDVKKSGSNVSTALSALIQTELNITGEKISNYDISVISIKPIEVGDPLDISLNIDNKGNVAAKPTYVHVEVFDKLNTSRLEAQDLYDIDFAEPFTISEITIFAPTKLPLGQYWAHISVYKDNILLKKQELVFEIVDAGSLPKQGNFIELKPVINGIIRENIEVIGLFKNAGLINYQAKLVVNIYQKDQLVEVVESNLIKIVKGKTESLTAYFIPNMVGEYTIKAHVEYSGRKSEELIENITVNDISTLNISPVKIAISMISLFVLIYIIVYFCVRKKN